MKTSFIFLVFAVTAVAPAQVLFSTLGPGDSYVENVGRAVSGANNAISQSYGEWGWQFTSSASGVVGQIKVGAHWLVGENSALIRIHSNGAGETMGATLASYTISGMPAFNGGEQISVLNLANPTVNLTGGTKYWISMAPTHSNTYAAWMDSDQGMFGRMSVSSDGVNYNYVNNMPYSAFSLTAVPEPASMFALILGGAALLRRRGRRA